MKWTKIANGQVRYLWSIIISWKQLVNSSALIATEFRNKNFMHLSQNSMQFPLAFSNIFLFSELTRLPRKLFWNGCDFFCFIQVSESEVKPLYAPILEKFSRFLQKLGKTLVSHILIFSFSLTIFRWGSSTRNMNSELIFAVLCHFRNRLLCT